MMEDLRSAEPVILAEGKFGFMRAHPTKTGEELTATMLRVGSVEK